jgi:GNAT superfamily N-acetyltransferase
MQDRTRIEDFQESNIDDLIHVCSSKRLNDLLHQKGVSLKKRWLHNMLAQYGCCAKIAYLDDKPVAQVLYHPEEADASRPFRRENVLVLDCTYNPTLEAQRLGIGTRLLRNVVQDARQRKTCLGNKPCKFITAKAFNTSEFLPLPEFYKRNGFLPTPAGNQLYLPIESGYEQTPSAGEYEPFVEDRDRALIFYGSSCQFSYPFAKKIEALIRETIPSLEPILINEWEQPEEALRRKNSMVIVNAKAIQTFFMETEKFKEEIRQAVS